jgi:hypothetical protein
VAEDTSLERLHGVLQAAFEWTDDHLHEFSLVSGRGNLAPRVTNEAKLTVGGMLPSPKARLRYLYDFGDSWEHLIELEKVLPAEPAGQYPVCVAGERSAPPEDCGGIWGYYNMLEALQDEGHPEHEHYLDWIEEWDPDDFDLARVNERLAWMRARGKGKGRK